MHSVKFTADPMQMFTFFFLQLNDDMTTTSIHSVSAVLQPCKAASTD